MGPDSDFDGAAGVWQIVLGGIHTPAPLIVGSASLQLKDRPGGSIGPLFQESISGVDITDGGDDVSF